MVSSTFKDFQTVYEVEIWCLCTVTFGQKSSKSNSRPVYGLQLYGISGYCQTCRNYQQAPQRSQNLDFHSQFSGLKIIGIFQIFSLKKNRLGDQDVYCKVASSRLSWLVAHSRIFRLFMKGKFDAYVLWPLAKSVQYWIVDRLLLATLGYVVLCQNCSTNLERYLV